MPKNNMLITLESAIAEILFVQLVLVELLFIVIVYTRLNLV